MKVYTKKNNGLRFLGEGMVFSKGQLMLKEDKPIQVDLTGGEDASGPSEVSKEASDLKSKTAGLGDNVEGVMSLDDSKWTTTPNIAPNEPGSDVKIPADDKSPKSIEDATKKAIQMRAGGITVPLNQSVTPRKVMDEMRANSVPFTKTELTKFLKSI